MSVIKDRTVEEAINLFDNIGTVSSVEAQLYTQKSLDSNKSFGELKLRDYNMLRGIIPNGNVFYIRISDATAIILVQITD